MEFLGGLDVSFKEGLDNLLETLHKEEMPMLLGLESGKPSVFLTLEMFNAIAPEVAKIDLKQALNHMEEARDEALQLLEDAKTGVKN